MTTKLTNLKLDSISLVSRCPYCDARFDEEGTTHDGAKCDHPTRIQHLEARAVDDKGRSVSAMLSGPPPCKVCKSEEHGHITVAPFEFACPLDVKIGGVGDD